jgi:hypothetical protein
MVPSLNPHLTVAQTAPLLEQEFRTRLGDAEFEKLYRTLELHVEEQTTDEEGQVIGIITLVALSTNKTNLFLSLVWLAKKEVRDPYVQEMLGIVRQKTLSQLLQEARKAVHDSPKEHC